MKKKRSMEILGGNALKQLVETLLFMFGLHSAFHAGMEHKSLRVGVNSQLSVHTDHENDLHYLQYCQDFAKKNPGRSHQSEKEGG